MLGKSFGLVLLGPLQCYAQFVLLQIIKIRERNEFNKNKIKKNHLKEIPLLDGCVVKKKTVQKEKLG